MSKNGLNKKGKSAHSGELRFTLDSAGRGTAAELLRRLKPYRFKFALSLGLSLVYVFLTLLIPVLAGKIIDCIIGAGSLIGMGAVILDGAKIGNDCIIGAGSLVTKNTVIPDGSLVLGSPAKIKRNLTWEEKLGNLENSREYVKVSGEMKAQGIL